MFGFSKKSQSAPPPRQVIKIVERELGSLTLSEWCSDKGLTGQARQALSSPLLRRMLQVLHNSHPAFQVMTLADTSARALQQARCEGYTLALADLESMGTHIPKPELIEADFLAEEVDQSLASAYGSDGTKRA